MVLFKELEIMDAIPYSQNIIQVEFPPCHSVRRILVVGNECILIQGMVSLLTTKQNLEVSYFDDCTAHDLLQLHPDVVILCQSEPNQQCSKIAWFDLVASLTNIMIIIINLECTRLKVYQHHQWKLATIADFFPLIYNENSDNSLKKLRHG
jgi:hypothetical protein